MFCLVDCDAHGLDIFRLPAGYHQRARVVRVRHPAAASSGRTFGRSASKQEHPGAQQSGPRQAQGARTLSDAQGSDGVSGRVREAQVCAVCGVSAHLRAVFVDPAEQGQEGRDREPAERIQKRISSWRSHCGLFEPRLLSKVVPPIRRRNGAAAG